MTADSYVASFGPSTLTVALSVGLVCLLHYVRYARGKIHLPGPVPLPIVGNLLSVGEVSCFCMLLLL